MYQVSSVCGGGGSKYSDCYHAMIIFAESIHTTIHVLQSQQQEGPVFFLFFPLKAQCSFNDGHFQRSK